MTEHGGNKISTRNGNWNHVESAIDVLANILSRVPVKSLLVSKSVSKLWHMVIGSPNFIGLQLCESRENPVYMVYPVMEEVKNVYLVNGNGEMIEMVTLPGLANTADVRIICSFNGLICCINHPLEKVLGKKIVDVDDLEIRICNPATREVLLLPKGQRSYDLPIVGVGFGPGIEDYTIFRFFCGRNLVTYKCEMFSSITGSWRQIGSVAQHPMNYHHVFVEGKVYWFIKSEESEAIPGSILSVDMEGNFKTISLPMEVNEHSFLIVFEGTLSLLVVFDEEETMQMWSLEDSDLSTWEVKCSVEIPYDTSQCPDSVVARGRDIFLITSYQYFIFNLDLEIWRELNLRDEFDGISPVVFTYTESLLSCKFHDIHNPQVFKYGPLLFIFIVLVMLTQRTSGHFTCVTSSKHILWFAFKAISVDLLAHFYPVIILNCASKVFIIIVYPFSWVTGRGRLDPEH